MNYRCAIALGLCLLASGCVTNPNRFEHEGGWVTYEVLEVGTGKHKLTVEGGPDHTKAQVDRAYALRASQLCGGQGVSGEPEYIRSTYFGPAVSMVGMRQRAGYRLAGVITCPGATVAQPASAAQTADVAVFRDSAKALNERTADLFYLSRIDDQKIEDSYERTRRVNWGRGRFMGHEVVERNVPAKTATFTIEGRTRHTALVYNLTSYTRTVTGTVTFTPEKYKTYVVKGQLGADYSAVWIEEELEGGGSKMVGDKIEDPARTK